MIWSALLKIHKAGSQDRDETYLMQYQVLQMKPVKNLMQYANRYTSLENKMASVGHVVTDEERERFLLCGL